MAEDETSNLKNRERERNREQNRAPSVSSDEEDMPLDVWRRQRWQWQLLCRRSGRVGLIAPETDPVSTIQALRKCQQSDFQRLERVPNQKGQEVIGLPEKIQVLKWCPLKGQETKVLIKKLLRDECSVQHPL
ncbi:hypothetical protein E4U13_004345 [Claviceps humidiphila]|uniref:Uncharacterized protein n=1 Tax=Claviceps humidiphila TaxID=1294629 RepID=A0A9P7Q8Q8_9HYPO|nr:hypothetical protein E4U13_004345 [Claviceps humidiphila]